MAIGDVSAETEMIELPIPYDVDLRTTPPVDLSFQKIKIMPELQLSRPRKWRVGRPAPRSSSGKFISQALWLNSNSIRDINGIFDIVKQLFEYPSMLQWIDFSYNNIEIISTDILNFKHLKILYFHGNCINNFNEIAKLKSLKQLKSLTLHGCPIEVKPFYRLHIVSLLRQLKNLDFVTITPKEAHSPPPPGANL